MEMAMSDYPVRWMKSSYSADNGNCVEVGTRWTKSSYSVDNGNCVEVAAVPDTVKVRDSKNAEGPVLAFPADRWAAFLATTA